MGNVGDAQVTVRFIRRVLLKMMLLYYVCV